MRKPYDNAFNVKVANDIIQERSSVSHLVNEYGVSGPVISRWLAEGKCYQTKAFAGLGKRLPDKAKIHALEQENKRLQ